MVKAEGLVAMDRNGTSDPSVTHPSSLTVTEHQSYQIHLTGHSSVISTVHASGQKVSEPRLSCNIFDL